MIVSEEDQQVFVNLGLTLLQTKIYLSLVGIGRANVKKISKVSRVSRPDIYRCIYKLQDLGLIEQEITKPVIFKAIPIKHAIELLLNRKKIEQDELKERSELFIEKFGFDDTHSLEEETKLILVPSQDALIRRLKKAIDNAQQSIEIASSLQRFYSACNIFSENLEKAWNRNVKGRALIQNGENKQSEFIKKTWKSPIAQIRFTFSSLDTIMAMYDKREVFIFTRPSQNLRDSPALWTDNPGIVAMAKNYFEMLWSTSIEN